MEFLNGDDLAMLIRSIGYFGIFAVIASESGLLIGIFLPGDSLLFTAGFIASQGYLKIELLFLVSFLGAIAGDAAGYMIGKRAGPKIFTREHSLFLKKSYIERTRLFYEKYGAKTVIIARFIPFVRTLAPIFAGVGTMHYPRFMRFNIIGGLLWSGSMIFGGYFLGRIVPQADRFLLPITAFVILLSILPSLIHFWREQRRS